MADTESSLRTFLEKSSFVETIARYTSAAFPGRLAGGSVRPLSEKEIKQLIAFGNNAGDWSTVKVVTGFTPDYVHNNTFYGNCVLGVYSGVPREAAPGVMLPSGVYDSTVVDSELGDECLVRGCGLIARYLVDSGAVVMDVGALTAAGGSGFGNGIAIRVGCETGGREVPAVAELDIDLAARLALERDNKDLQRRYADLAERYRESASCEFGIVEKDAVIRRTTEIADTFVGRGARIEGALLVGNCTILSSVDERTVISHGTIVENSCLQWGCAVASQAIVTDSLLTEYARVERQGKVTASILGPNTSVAEGEVTSCLLGPFVGFHHQSLLIAALWPQGKGNVAYGANVGSNHTSRAPDQEIFCGEGVFFGLGTNIKFPADYSHAPYSIIATGVDTLPQKVEFPFSLIASPSRTFSDISPAFNQISPAWVLSDNIYMVRRNEAKYRKRNRARRTVFDGTVFRPAVVDLMVAARNRLRDVQDIKKAYMDRDIPGLGKNYLWEESRLRAVEAYGFYIEYYCLAGLRDRIRGLVNARDDRGIESVYTHPVPGEPWEHRRILLLAEHNSDRPLRENLERLIGVLEKIEADIYRTKSKDDERGGRIIADYHEVAVSADEDAFIRETRAEIAREIGEIRELIGKL